MIRTIFCLALWAAFGLGGLARGQAVPETATPGAEKAVPTAAEPPGMADLIPAATELEQRLAALESEIESFPPVDGLENVLQEFEARFAQIDVRFQSLVKAGDFGYEDVAGLKQELEAERDNLEKALIPVRDVLATLDRRKAQWEGEAERWSAWRKESPAAKEADEVFRTASKTASRALGLVTQTARPFLGIQRRGENLRLRIGARIAEAEGLLQAIRNELWRRSAPSMLSASYEKALREVLDRETLLSKVRDVRWPDPRFWRRTGWIVALQIALVVLVFGLLRRNRARLLASDRWRFLSERSAAAAGLVGVGLPAILYPVLYPVLPPLWRFLLWTVVGLSAARLVTGLLEAGWRRRLVYLLAGLFLLNQALRVAEIPPPIFRLYVFGVAAAGAVLCLWRARVAARLRDDWYAWALRLAAILLAAVTVAQIFGYANLAAHLLDAAIQTTFLLLLAWVLEVLAHGALDFVVRSTLWQRLPLGRRHADRLQTGILWAVRILLGLAVWGLVMEVWRISESPWKAIQALLAFGFSAGDTRITVGLVSAAALLLYGALFTSWVVQGLLENEVYPRRGVDRGTGLSINRLVHYVLVLVGFLAALSALGLELRNLTILVGAFGIGIGFGLQTIVNNFVSGLILLFERPIKVGDVVELDGEWGVVRKLGLRATVVETLQQSEVIVPNADLVAGKVTNWTLSTRMVRAVVPVGVAYGSDVDKVMEILQAVAEELPEVRKNPPPQVLFRAFGESSLDFELRVWVSDVDDRLRVLSELHRAIDRRFREAGVEIPFPQRDLHVRSVDERAAVRLRPRPATVEE